jgi:hypothetical protein
VDTLERKLRPPDRWQLTLTRIGHRPARVVGRAAYRAPLWFRAAVLVVTFAAPAGVEAQTSAWHLEEHHYFDPILAEPRGAQTSVLFPGAATSVPFAVFDRRSLVWDISLGRELPILGFSSNKGGESPVGVPPHGFGLGLWFPLSFHMIEDMGKDPSNPILNTDYRFGGLVKAQWGLPGSTGFWSSAHVGAKLQFGHESTHIGDEFTLGALRTHAATFLRVNVSYEYYEVAGSFEPNIGNDGQYQLKVRAGTIWLWRPADGWYSPDLLQPYGNLIARSRRNHEPYAQFEVYRQPTGTSRLGVIVSADCRDRTIYQYVPSASNVQLSDDEPTQWSVNVLAGIRHVRSGSGLAGRISPTYYLRFYRGVNPNGQFRSQSDFNEVGFGVQFGF